MEISDSDISNLRSEFFNKLKEKSLTEDDIHPADLNRIKANGDWLRRFLRHHDNDQAEALKMLFEACEWRKSFGANEITEKNINMTIVNEGSIFARNRDKDGKALLIFKSKKHAKGRHNFDELKRVLVYWVERLDRENPNSRKTVFFDAEGAGWSNMDMDVIRFLIDVFNLYYPASLNYIIVFEQPWILNDSGWLFESSNVVYIFHCIIIFCLFFIWCRENNGDMITVFFDMDGAGMSNMDMEFTKYIIGLFKNYYPFFLNYILILEMSWVLNTAFNIIKTWLPPKAVQKIKFLKKDKLSEFVDPSQQLSSWGGNDDYVFEFVPEVRTNAESERKKVHFADRSPGSEDSQTFPNSTPAHSINHNILINPQETLQFAADNGEFSASVHLKNVEPSSISISYKIKTTSPEKFRVRPSSGTLAAGETAVVSVILQPGYETSSLQRDKFLVMSIPITPDRASFDFNELWKVGQKDVLEHRLRCALPTSALSSSGSTRNGPISEGDRQINKLSNSITSLHNDLNKMSEEIRRIQIQQWILLLLVAVLTAVIFVSRKDPTEVFRSAESPHDAASCYGDPLP